MLFETEQDVFTSSLGVNITTEEADRLIDQAEHIVSGEEPFSSRLRIQARKRNRTSRAALVLDSIRDHRRRLYRVSDPRKLDYSYTNAISRRPFEIKREPKEPVSLYSIVSRQLRHRTEGASAAAIITRKDYTIHKERRRPRVEGAIEWTSCTHIESAHVWRFWTKQELAALEKHRYSPEHVEMWTTCLLTPDSIPASAAFQHDRSVAPLFVLLLFLRRNRIRALALGVVMRHVRPRMEAGTMDWSSFRLLTIRLLRHARKVWPEAIPSIASYFCTGASHIYSRVDQQLPGSKLTRSLTSFCNTLLSLIALPAPEYPMIAGIHQEEAQFIVLNFMANFNPALIVTRHGFRAVARNQLTHAKTTKEREWAELKGPSWPPWKENRHAMDEDKDYAYAASRASRILHRLFEAGYSGRKWETLAETYAGWDADLSPTIQTRATLPQTLDKDDPAWVDAMLWAARVRTTRTRREAWACFLAYEESGVEAHTEVYLAMFEKLHHLETRTSESKAKGEQHEVFDGSTETTITPGDMKEVLPDPQSPLHLVYLSEPVPSYDEFYTRMTRKALKPKGRLLAFLLDTHPDFSTCLHLLKSSQTRFHSGVGKLLHNAIRRETSLPVPEYFFTVFIRFLCRFSRVTKPPADSPPSFSSAEHDSRLARDRTYLIDYAHALLVHFRPAARPPWTAYLQKVVYGHNKKRSAHAQYTAVRRVFADMAAADVDLDDEQFQLLCTVVRYAAQTAHKGNLAPDVSAEILGEAPALLRSHFHSLVGANVGPGAPISPAASEAGARAKGSVTLHPHVPSPAALHAYVRALGFLRDYEGLYSFSSWVTTFHREVSVRALAQHGGPTNLYRALVALRAGLEGVLDGKGAHEGAPEEIRELVRAQVEGVRGWRWPGEGHVEAYVGWGKSSTGG